MLLFCCCDSIYGFGATGYPVPGREDRSGDGAAEMNEGGEPDRNLKLMLRLEKKRSVLYVLR